MTDETVIFTEEERRALCLNDSCEEHSDGDVPCAVPRTKDEAERQIKAEQRTTTSNLNLEDVEPKTATAEIVRSDE